MFFSVVVPVYNRPDEIDELLSSICLQSYKKFEVLIIEDGSGRDCREIVNQYMNRLDLHYYFKKNSGQGFSRNYGFERAKGDYFVVFDSDCLIPSHYFQTVVEKLESDPLDAWGGPDKAHPRFSTLQKAISYSMTSPLTTGGIRGGKRHVDRFYPRSFNMGISRKVFEATGGYRLTRLGEDLEFSTRIIDQGFRVGLIEEAFVYHKRRTTLRQFFEQLHFFGRARINLYRLHPSTLKPFHLIPAASLFYPPVLLLLMITGSRLLMPLLLPAILYFAAIFLHSLIREKELGVAFLSLVTTPVQLTAYALGTVQEALFPRHTREIM